MRRRWLPGELHLTSRAHAVFGAIAIVLLPAASWLDGSGHLAWTMFSRTGSFRFRSSRLALALHAVFELVGRVDSIGWQMGDG